MTPCSNAGCAAPSGCCSSPASGCPPPPAAATSDATAAPRSATARSPSRSTACRRRPRRRTTTGFLADVTAFEKANPNIKIDAHEGKMDPQTFPAKLAGGQLEDVFYVYFTDPASLIAKQPGRRHHRSTSRTSRSIAQHQARAAEGLPGRRRQDLRPAVDELLDGPGLQPRRCSPRPASTRTSPPTTWAEVRDRGQEDRRARQRHRRLRRLQQEQHRRLALHRRALLASAATSPSRTATPGRPPSTTPRASRSCSSSRTCAGPTTSMGQKQLLEWADLLQHDGRRQARHVRRRRRTTSRRSSTSTRASTRTTASAPIPGGKGTLGGGDGYMFKPGLSPEKIKAGLKWLTFKFSSTRTGSRPTTSGPPTNNQPVGLPEPAICDRRRGAEAGPRPTQAVRQRARGELRAVRRGNATIPLKLEPPNAQQIYAVLDTAMPKVLTDKNADIDQLLADAEKQVNTILASGQVTAARPPAGRDHPPRPSPATARASRRTTKAAGDGGHSRRRRRGPARPGCAARSRTTSRRTRSWRRASSCFALFSWYPMVRGRRS